MAGFIKKVGAARLEGERPSVPAAVMAAMVVGIGAAVVTYKLLRA